MEKPFDLMVLETRERLSAVINESQLPITMVAAIVRDLSNHVHHLERCRIEQLSNRTQAVPDGGLRDADAPPNRARTD